MNVEQQEVQSIVSKRLFEDRMYVELPEGTVEMPGDMIRELYPYEKRPQHIYYQEKNSLHFTFSLLEKRLEDKQVAEAIAASLQVIDAAYPQRLIGQANLARNTSDRQYGWFAFQSPSLETPRYNIMYITSVDHRVMHGTCSCLLEDEESQRTIKQVPLSIQIIGKEVRNVWSPLRR